MLRIATIVSILDICSINNSIPQRYSIPPSWRQSIFVLYYICVGNTNPTLCSIQTKTMNYKQTDYAANMLPNIMERDYGRGIVMAQVEEDGVIPFSVFNFEKENWSWESDYYMTAMNFYTLEEAETAVSELLAELLAELPAK